MSDKRITVWVQRFNDRPHLVLQWTDPVTGRRKSQSAGTDDEKLAEAKRGDLEADLNHGRHKEASRLSWAKFRELFEEEYVSALRPNTRRNHKNTLDLFERLVGTPSLRGVNERALSAFAAAMRREGGKGGGGMKPVSIKVRLQFLHTTLKWAVQQKYLPECPNFPGVKVPDKAPQPIPTETVERLLDKAADPTLRTFLLAGWLAGLRLSEAFHLEWERTDMAPYLDLDRDRIIVPAEFGKSVRDQWVPLDPVLRETIEGLPRHGRRVFHFHARDGHPVTAGHVSWAIRDLAKKAGVKLTMHSLRKGFGCRYAGRVPAQVLQKLMRHGDIKTTMAFYANVDAAVEEAVLGPKRNRIRNTRPEGAGQTGEPCAQSDTGEGGCDD